MGGWWELEVGKMLTFKNERGSVWMNLAKV